MYDSIITVKIKEIHQLLVRHCAAGFSLAALAGKDYHGEFRNNGELMLCVTQLIVS